MKYEITHEKSHRCLVVTTTGSVSVEDVVASIEAIQQHPQWGDCVNLIFDHRKLSVKQLSRGDLHQIATLFHALADQIGKGKVALVMSDSLSTIIANIWKVITERNAQFYIKTFLLFDEAMVWISEDDLA